MKMTSLSNVPIETYLKQANQNLKCNNLKGAKLAADAGVRKALNNFPSYNASISSYETVRNALETQIKVNKRLKLPIAKTVAKIREIATPFFESAFYGTPGYKTNAKLAAYLESAPFIGAGHYLKEAGNFLGNIAKKVLKK